jgi:hypothetical protein
MNRSSLLLEVRLVLFLLVSPTNHLSFLGWANTKETPFPAFKKVSRYVVGDFFSPSLYERAILKCIPCINRKIQCGGLDLFSPCIPCKEQHVKCSRSNTTMEHLLLFDSLRPHFGLSPDGASLGT